MTKTIVIKDNVYLNHLTTPGHPECARRLESIYGAIENTAFSGCYQSVSPRKAEKPEIALNHSMDYIERIEKTAGKPFTSLDPDTSTSAGSWDAAVHAVGGVLKGLDMIMGKEADNGFALVRPPGHHAEASRAMGFCLFNNIAVGAHHLINTHNLQKMLLIDWDIHHGNGTQNAFYDTPQVLYFSTHQYPYYPGTGAMEETGAKQGTGYTVNVPLHGGQDGDDFVKIFKEILLPVADEYKPEFILVSAGYDIYCGDPLGTMDVTPEGFFSMTNFLKKMAETYCDGRIFLALEGGYNITGIADSVKSTIEALAGSKASTVSGDSYQRDMAMGGGNINGIINAVKKTHAQTWKCFR